MWASELALHNVYVQILHSLLGPSDALHQMKKHAPLHFSCGE